MLPKQFQRKGELKMLTQKITDDDILNPEFRLKLNFLGKERSLERLNEEQKSRIKSFEIKYQLIFRSDDEKELIDKGFYSEKESIDIVKQAKAFLKKIFLDITNEELEHLSGIDFEALNQDIVYWDERVRGLSDEQIQRFRNANLEKLIKQAEDPDFQNQNLTENSDKDGNTGSPNST
jgi:uncharacterized protein YjbI with pentapeptide repeats